MSPWTVLAAAMTAGTAVSLIGQAYPILAPYIRADLGLSLAAVGLLNTFIYTGTMLGSLPSGWLTDKLGSRKVMIAGTLIGAGLALAVALFVKSQWAFIPFLFLVGLVVASATPAGSQAVARSFPPERRGLVIGLRQMAVPLGGTLAAAVLPAVAHLSSWRWASAVAALLGVLAAWVTARLYQEPSSSPTPIPGPRPRLRQVLQERNILLASVAGVTLPTGQFVMITYLILFLKERLGVPELTGAALLTAAQLAGALSRVFWSWLSDALGGQRKPLLVTMVAMAGLCALVLAWLPPGTPLFLKTLVVVLYGATALGWQGLHFSLMTELSPPGWEGRVVGFALVFTSIGIALAPPLFGLLVDLSQNYALGWLAQAAVFGLGAWLLSNVAEPKGARRG
ncbi:MAG: MFS transporter [Meiothermus sp.]|uniref:MFS transporter n=1 Tax=Meiothermus sp. TaxID=1955249 RepID=UPI0025EF24B8|nr:MFS transporter [Meiothermus sp.]MCS7057931.1 MFS transporter [Meiothermus sp.]MCS7194193.1 MFS transporter [Meiothermus sp.]MCX7741176.1 MFS transporter [Meiothermus sp.]MDW8090054.1 MFS transporter [Meiothermus sp.]MDW8480702.1 MFS transporter [Meiothermus sp.]